VSQIGGAPRAEASDHDDGETDLKSRALNLSDHFAFKSPADPNVLSLVMYFNPRSLPGRQYFLSTSARYEFHITKVASKTAVPAPKDDIVLRFEASPPTAAGTQFITLTVLKNGSIVGSHIGRSTDFPSSQADDPTDPANRTIVENVASIDGQSVHYFVGMRADSFFFDVNRFFQVRAFLVQRFFGGPGNTGLPICTTAGQTGCATLAPNCEGDAFLQGVLGTDSDLDKVNLFNPHTCAPDFTKNLNVTAIVANVPKALLGGGDLYDTWSTISVRQ
jgi:hypothetical protein